MLPKIEYPTTEVKLLSTGKKVRMRPMTINEEKVLLTARESGSRMEILQAIVQILNACVEGSISINQLPSYDIEWLFIKLRAQSVSNIVKLNFTPESEEDSYPFEVDLNKVEPKWPEEKINHIIGVSDDVEICMQHTPIMALSTEDVTLTDIIADSITQVLHNEQPVVEESREAKKAWVDTLPSHVLEKINEYLSNVPVIEHHQKIVLKDGTEEIVRLESIFDFFTL